MSDRECMVCYNKAIVLMKVLKSGAHVLLCLEHLKQWVESMEAEKQ